MPSIYIRAILVLTITATPTTDENKVNIYCCREGGYKPLFAHRLLDIRLLQLRSRWRGGTIDRSCFSPFSHCESAVSLVHIIIQRRDTLDKRSFSSCMIRLPQVMHLTQMLAKCNMKITRRRIYITKKKMYNLMQRNIWKIWYNIL